MTPPHGRPVVALVAGTRPNFVKIAPLVHAFERLPQRLPTGSSTPVSTTTVT